MKELRPISKIVLYLLCIFLIAFPKGGFKVGTIPITWGYILLFLVCAASFFLMWKEGLKVYLPAPRLQVLLLCFPFQAYAFFILMFSKVSSVGFLLSAMVSLIAMPFLFLLVLNNYFDRPNFRSSFIPLFKALILFVAIYGIFLFFYRIKSGITLEIPYLTANIDDSGTLDSEKNNMRGDLSKLISTYNNGNIYGVCVLIFFPLYMEYEKRFIPRVLVITSLILTLSRTAWVGLLIYFALTFSKEFLKPKTWIYLFLLIVVIAIAGPIILEAMGKDTSFLFDKDLGGRAKQLDALNDISFFGDFEFSAITEIVYLSILKDFGIIGLVFFVLYLMAPLIVHYNYRKLAVTQNAVSKAWWGLLLYVIIAASDGAILLIPVMAFYWFLAAFVFSDE